MLNCTQKKWNMLTRKFFALILLTILLYNCRPDSSPSGFDDNFDHAAQALIDADSISLFLSSYYYDDVSESLKKISGVETPLVNDSRLRTLDVVEDEVDYTLYYLMLREGNPQPVKGNPTIMDSVLTIYRGQRIVNNDSLLEFESRVTPIWLSLNTSIAGWTNTLPNFKGGRNVTTNGPIEYADGGKGVMFIPSGLAYRNRGSAGATILATIPSNANLIFFFDLYDIVEDTNHDNDLIPSIDEDYDGDGDPRNDDSDGDFLPDYLDNDDDNDGVLTRNEDANGDGDPRNDDTDGDGVPDYLDPDTAVSNS